MLRKIFYKTGWILSYFQMMVLVPFGTCTQGDDGPWRASLLYGVVPIIGLLMILLSPKDERKSTLMGIPHIVTLILILWNTPSYWIHCTFQGQHICAAFEYGYINAFEPSWWHRFWAPLVTAPGLACVVLGLRYFFKSY